MTRIPNRPLFIFLCILVTTSTLFSQEEIFPHSKKYHVNRRSEIPLTGGLFLTHIYAYKLIRSKESIDSIKLVNLSDEKLPGIDKWALKQDPAFRHKAHKISDISLNATVVLPVFLALDKKIRKEWFDILILYGETHAINSSLYVISAGLINRKRPILYSPGIPFEDKLSGDLRSSFFSGHVSSTACSSFFMAKVYSDYHPELGNKKYLLYAASLIPPSIVGIYRIKAYKHFPTDVIAGTVVGAACGILIPHLHKKNHNTLKILPIGGDVNGLVLNYKF